MKVVNLQDAKSKLSHWVAAIEWGEVREFIIARNGRPVARLVPLQACVIGPRIGVAKGLFEVPDDIDAYNAEVAEMILGRPSQTTLDC